MYLYVCPRSLFCSRRRVSRSPARRVFNVRLSCHIVKREEHHSIPIEPVQSRFGYRGVHNTWIRSTACFHRTHFHTFIYRLSIIYSSFECDGNLSFIYVVFISIATSPVPCDIVAWFTLLSWSSARFVVEQLIASSANTHICNHITHHKHPHSRRPIHINTQSNTNTDCQFDWLSRSCSLWLIIYIIVLYEHI